MMRLELKNWKGDPVGHIDWDREAGKVSGPLAARVLELMSYALADGYVMTDPYPTAYDIGAEPLRSARDLALILSTDWQVPPELRDALPPAPKMPDDLPPDIVF